MTVTSAIIVAAGLVVLGLLIDNGLTNFGKGLHALAASWEQIALSITEWRGHSVRPPAPQELRVPESEGWRRSGG